MGGLNTKELSEIFDDHNAETHRHVRNGGKGRDKGKKPSLDPAIVEGKVALVKSQNSVSEAECVELSPAQLRRAAEDAARHNLRMAGIRESQRHAQRQDARAAAKEADRLAAAARRAHKQAAKDSRYAKNDPAYAARLEQNNAQQQQGEAPAAGDKNDMQMG